MDTLERESKIQLFLELAAEISTAKDTIDELILIIQKFDLPKHVDRDFIFDCLIAFYSSLEEYENCALLLKIKQSDVKRKRFSVKNMTRGDLLNLRILGFNVPDSIKLKVLAKPR
jgi:hypothetical protein